MALKAAAQIPSGSILWLRADSNLTVENGKVMSWPDQSGLHHDVLQDDSQRRPILIVQGINGLPSLHFDGNSYFKAPGIFPANHDYSIAGVFRLSDTTVINNILAGSTHALWFNQNNHLSVHDFWFQLDVEASAPSNLNGSRFIVTYNAASSTVRIYIDGRLSDSLWVYPNDDTTLYIGAYNGGYCLDGDLSEIMLYNRELDSTDVAGLDGYLGTKYGL
ncbi:MAG TPA: LamG-like jellyroll fold domain-containing protein, partial [Candidatus Kapabacteria bacterium]